MTVVMAAAGAGISYWGGEGKAVAVELGIVVYRKVAVAAAL